jgi:hypothetical protein
MIIKRYHEKRMRRVWTKKIRYSCRKNLADRRIRIKGRFIKGAVGISTATVAGDLILPCVGSKPVSNRNKAVIPPPISYSNPPVTVSVYNTRRVRGSVNINNIHVSPSIQTSQDTNTLTTTETTIDTDCNTSDLNGDDSMDQPRDNVDIDNQHDTMQLLANAAMASNIRLIVRVQFHVIRSGIITQPSLCINFLSDTFMSSVKSSL